MPNVIQIKGKTTTGAPSLGDLATRELCYVIPDDALYIKRDASTIVLINQPGGTGDMTKAVYDANDDGKVASADQADNALQLGGVVAANYALETYVDAAIAALVASSPAALDTLNELAAALGDDANFSATVNASLASKLDANSTIDGGTIS